jgi:hypothetical protein
VLFELGDFLAPPAALAIIMITTINPSADNILCFLNQLNFLGLAI